MQHAAQKVDRREFSLSLNIFSFQVGSKVKMAASNDCLGHNERGARVNKIKRMLDSPHETPDENLRVFIKRGPNKEETSLKELEENYASKPEWEVIEGEECSASLSRSSG